MIPACASRTLARYYKATLFAAVVFSSSAAYPQAPVKNRGPFELLQDAVADLRDAAKSNPRLHVLVGRLRDQVADLQDAVGGQVGSLYATSLVADAAAMSEASKRPNDRGSTSMLANASDDLDAKLSSLRQSLGLTTGTAGLLEVSISTVRSGKVVDGYLIRANCAGAPDVNPPIGIFDRRSSPTTAMLPPGVYVIFAKDTEFGGLLASQYVRVSGPWGKPIDLTLEVK